MVGDAQESFRRDLVGPLQRYRARFADQVATCDQVAAVLVDGPAAASRNRAGSHITGSAYVLSSDGCYVLLILHRALNRWLQPGGHLDQMESPWAAAEREAVEETGIGKLALHPWHAHHGHMPFDIDIHDIPARPAKGEPPHQHIDWRYIFISAERSLPVPQADEVHEARWMDVSALGDILSADAHRRLKAVLDWSAG